MKRLLGIFLLGILIPAQAEEQPYVLTVEQWSVPRRAETLLKMPVLSQIMQDMRSSPDNRLVIRYPGGDEGTLWAHELRGWLVSLGLSSKNIELVPGSSRHEAIELDILRSHSAASIRARYKLSTQHTKLTPNKTKPKEVARGETRP